MSRPFTNITLNEGYTDLPTFDIDITGFEVESSARQTEIVKTTGPDSTSLLFKVEFSDTALPPVPTDYAVNFVVKMVSGELTYPYTVNPNSEGYMELKTALFPIVNLGPPDDKKVVQLEIQGPLSNRSEECYIQLAKPGGGPEEYLYTLISDLAVSSGYLCVYDGNATYYKILPQIAVAGGVGSLYINEKGKIYGHNGSTWSALAETLKFVKVTNPKDDLLSFADGFYTYTGALANIKLNQSLGTVGSEFASSRAVLVAPESFNVNVDISVTNPGGAAAAITPTSFTNKTPGSRDFNLFKITNTIYTAPDTSPTITQIQAVAGITFAAPLLTFLNTKGLTTLNAIQKAGPLRYINGFPTSGYTASHVTTLQSHADLYFINKDRDQNQILINKGYDSIYAIANTPKSAFLTDTVVSGGPALFAGAQIHELAANGQRLLTNRLAGNLVDLRQQYSVYPPVPNNTFISQAFAPIVNSCGCDDCQSSVSPFAYLMDLMKYGALHVYHDTSPTYAPGNPVNYTSFINVLSTMFLQPFGTLDVDCKTLHDEFCRVRLVSEVLQKAVDGQVLGTIPAIRTTTLTSDKNQFLSLTYSTLLVQAGTSLIELRNIVTIGNSSDKKKAAQKLVDRLGIPLYVPPSGTVLTVDRMWLTLNGSGIQQLTAANLENLFGFRDITRDVLQDTPKSLIETWQEYYLDDIWSKQDYYFSQYSREGVNPSDNLTFKSNWKPIIDPDIIGWADMTYFTSPFASNLWKHRKAETDAFLSYYVSDSSVTSRSSADITSKILKVSGRDIVSHVIEGNQVKIENSSSAWLSFDLINRNLNNTNTDVILKKSSSIFQPNGSAPKMRYKRVIAVETITPGTNSAILNWTDPVIADLYSVTTGYFKIQSDNVADPPYEKNGTSTSPYLIASVTVGSTTQVTLSLGQNLSAAFLAGKITFVYEVEVPLYTYNMVDPLDICNNLFTTSRNYTLLSPVAFTSPVSYTVWLTPANWQGITGTTDYDKLKDLYQRVTNGAATSAQLQLIADNLFMSVNSFNRLMQLLAICERYLAAMFSAKQPTTEELYELASVLRSSSKVRLRDTWVKEEIKHIISGGTTPEMLMLNLEYFWKSLSEPISGAWDPSLQTIPALVADISSTHQAIIDPELLGEQELLLHPSAKPYRDLYAVRKTALANQQATYMALVNPYDSTGITKILNHVNTGSTGTPFTLTSYATLADLILDLGSFDAITQKKAADELWDAFRLTVQDFQAINTVKLVYEDVSQVTHPSLTELEKIVKLLVSAYKRKRLYPTLAGGNWIKDEINGSFASGTSVFYYNVRKMRLPVGRSDAADRTEWQKTLKLWNRLPLIQPDIVAPENVKHFIPSAIIHDYWIDRKIAINADYTTLSALFNASLNSGALLTNLKNQINLLIARVHSFTPIALNPYLPYFEELAVKEKNGEDIRPMLEQFGITVSEYRVLNRVYTVLSGVSAGTTSPLIESEYADIIDIILHVRAVNLTFVQVQEEYNDEIILSSDGFKLYKAPLSNFPKSDLPVYNQWRSPYTARKEWLNILESRIEREKGIIQDWKEVLKETEDRTMPFMRDALVRTLAADCESLDAAAERLAKTFFVETKDNCCVKHTRVSFAIETVQGLLYALNNGIYDTYINTYRLVAPNFQREWQWLGSYATWRSAVFTFIYPENLLYPSLKRLQSPVFIKIAEKLQNANKLNPSDACLVAKDYHHYLEDVHNLRMVCTANAPAFVLKENPNLCCGDPETKQLKNMSYFFAQSTTSGRSYWSFKDFDVNTTSAHSFWEELPIAKEATLIGCFVLGGRDSNWFSIETQLILFYTFRDGGKLKMEYLKKDLMSPSSTWEQQTMTDLPVWKIPDPNNSSNFLSGELGPNNVTACQNAMDWEYPSFIIAYSQGNDIYHVHQRYMYQKDEFIEEQAKHYKNNSQRKAISGIRHTVKQTGGSQATDYSTYTMVFEKQVVVSTFGNSINQIVFPDSFTTSGYGPNTIKRIIGAFESMDAYNTIIVVFEAFGYVNAVKLKLDFSVSNAFPHFRTYSAILTNMSLGSATDKLTDIYPVFAQSIISNKCTYATKTNTNAFMGAYIRTLTTCTCLNRFQLAPEKKTWVPVESADCVTDINARAQDIKTNIIANTTASAIFTRTTAVREYLYEGYYHVPMLIALDQQKRGQFQSSLSWYRSVYDYTNVNELKRKIFYGLVLEENIVNSYAHSADWLLDPLNPHLIALTRANSYTKYTITNIIQCLMGYGDREFTIDTIETVPTARKLYTHALELLKVKELKTKDDPCASSATNCVNSAVTLPASGIWDNLYALLQKDLASLGDVALIQSVTTNVIKALNNTVAGTPLPTYEERFDYAFQLVETARAGQTTTTQTVVQVMSGVGGAGGIKQRADDAYRYVFALDSAASFNTTVAEGYSRSVAGISGLEPSMVADPGSVSKLSWLLSPTPSNSASLNFSFANASGQQNLTEYRAYDPLNPTRQAYAANQAYSNPNVFMAYQSSDLPVDPYTPLISYNFCTPVNPVYRSLELKGNLELYKIHNCRNIAGMVRELSVYAAATDSVSGMPVIGASGNLVAPGLNNFAPTQYRFKVLIERAKQIAAQAQQLESLFLSSLEKLDAENYSQLRARQDLQTSKATVKLQDLRITQANSERSLADLQLGKVNFMKTHFDDLIESGWNNFEISSLALMEASVAGQIAAAILSIAATAANVGTAAMGSTQDFGSNAVSLFASSASAQGSIFSQMASYQRREEEWQFQSALADQDIGIANQQIKIADDNIRIVTQEREIAQINVDHAQDSYEFLKTKFTNAALYNWMSNVLERSYSYMLNLATSVAKTAEGQLYFERQEQAGPFVMDDYWETPNNGSGDRRGLTGSARLLVDITRLDQYAFDSFKRKLQLTKVISLAQNFPSEFNAFKETGVLNFELTNKMFDYDFPGHYMRLIHGVKTSVVGLVPVYDGIKATLTTGTTSYTVIGGTVFQKMPIKRMEVDSVALSGTTNASGIFELQQQAGELLNPFEGMGIESRWEFKMPQFSNRMDFANIADVLLTVEYTAMDSYQYRYQVLEELDNKITFNRGFSLKNDFPDQWFELGEVDPNSTATQFAVTLQLKRENFPQGILDLKLNDAGNLILFFSRDDGFTDEVNILDFNLETANSTPQLGGDSLNGIFRAKALMANLTGSPVINLRLVFDNTFTNRELFSKGKVKDILMVVPCKAELKAYPL